MQLFASSLPSNTAVLSFAFLKPDMKCLVVHVGVLGFLDFNFKRSAALLIRQDTHIQRYFGAFLFFSPKELDFEI